MTKWHKVNYYCGAFGLRTWAERTNPGLPMKNMMEYKGYLGSGNYNDEDEVFYGKVEHIRSLISYEGHDVESLAVSFHEAVDDYLLLCQKNDTEPEKPSKA